MHTNLCSGLYKPWNSFDTWLYPNVCVYIIRMYIRMHVLHLTMFPFLSAHQTVLLSGNEVQEWQVMYKP